MVQGEYVEFDLVKPDSGSHEYKAMSVTGISGGELMCETRTVTRVSPDSDDFITVRHSKRASHNNQSTSTEA